MSFTGALTLDDLAQGMPVGAPLYPLPPTVYQDCAAFAVEYESDAESVAALLPHIFEVPDPAIVTANFITIPQSSLGAYHEVQVTVNVLYQGQPRRFHVFMYVSEGADVPLAMGRELLGAPKKAARIRMEREPEAHVATVDRPAGFPLIRAFVAPKTRLDLPGSSAPAPNPTMMMRVIPYLDGEEPTERIDLVEAQSSYEIHELWSGTAGLSITGMSQSDPLHLLPVRRIRSGSSSRLTIVSPRVRTIERLR